MPAAAVTALAIEAGDAGAAALQVLSSDEVTASGTCGTCTWTLYDDGELVIAPTSGDTGTLDSITDVIEENAPWLEYCTDIVSVVVDGTVVCGSSVDYMFGGCESIESMDLSGLDTSSVTSMCMMFEGCSSLQSLDLSSFDSSSVTDMDWMFAYCSSLTTVYVSGLWSLDGMVTVYASGGVEVSYSGNVFTDCTSLVGGNGTVYSSAHVNSEYARIDTDDEPGYFTYKAHEGESSSGGSSSGTSVGSSADSSGTTAGSTSSTKKAQSITVKAKKATTVKYKKLKKKAQSVKASKLCKVTGAKGTLTYSKVSVKRNGKKASKKVAKKIAVSKAGKVTLKKGLAKGTYKVKLKVKAKATSKYKASAAKTVTVTIKVK